MQHSKIKVVGFDFDGTLIVSEGVKEKIMAKIFAQKFGVARGVLRAYRKLAGTGKNRDQKVIELFRQFVTRDPTKKELKTITDTFGEQYLRLMNSCPLFECTNILKEMRKQTLFMFLLSLEEKKEVKKLAKHCSLDKYFDDILGGPISKAKNLKRVILKYNIKPKEMLYIGDAHSDVTFAKKMGIKIILLGKKHKYGRLKEDLDADFVFSTLCEIPHTLSDLPKDP
jgi:phosphoglycolate phosphatase-like HAD superfamily hydrolase